MRAALPLAALLATAVPAQAQEEIGRSSVYGQEIILYDDNIWAFVDPTARMPEPLEGGACLEIGDGRVSVCPSEIWSDREVVFETNGTEVFLTNRETGTALSVFADETYGHYGDFDYYSDLGASGDLLLGAITRLAGIDSYTEDTFVRDDVVVVLTKTQTQEASISYQSVTIEILLSESALFLDLAVIGGLAGDGNVQSPDVEPVVKALLAATTIDGQSLPDWLSAAEDTR